MVPLAEKAPLTHHDGGSGSSPVDREASCCLPTGLGDASAQSVRRSTNGNYISTALESRSQSIDSMQVQVIVRQHATVQTG
jgi:hypothetical protein